MIVNSRPKILIASGTPPPYSGPEIMTAHLLNSSLRDQYTLIHFNISKGRGVETKAKFDLINIAYGIVQPIICLWLLLRHRPDMMYTNLAQTLGGFLRYASFIAPAVICQTPVVVRVMGDGFHHFYANSRGWKRRLIEWTLKNIDLYIVRAEALKEQFQGLVPPEKLIVVHSGIDVGEFALTRQRAVNSPLRVLFVGYLTQAKGALDLLRAIPKVTEAFPDVRFQLMGPRLDVERNITYHANPNSNNAALDQLLAEPTIQPYVELLGERTGAEKIRYFVEADLFVFPSYSEAFPTVVLEAMAAGLPIVTTPVGVLPELFDGRSIQFVKPGDVDELAEQIVDLLRDSERRTEMGNYNRQLASTKFDLEHHAQQMSRVFDQLLANPNPQTA